MNAVASAAPYLFGDSELAAKRLCLLAQVFELSTRAFLEEAVKIRPRLVVDLGCGPGATTHFLATVLSCDAAVGMDRSEPFIARARETATPRVSFCVHDFTQVPFPVESVDVMFGRYVLTHVREPLAVLQGWGSQLTPGGLLLSEETEWIQTEIDAFSSYLQISAAMLAHQSYQLYIGPWLDACGDIAGLRRKVSTVRRLPVANSLAARLFRMNLETWKHQPFVREHYPSDLILELERVLEQLAETPEDDSGIEWGLRQIAFERVE